MAPRSMLPDEVKSAANAASEMLSVVTTTSDFWLKQLFFALLPLMLGGVLGWVYVCNFSSKDLSLLKDVTTAFITVVTVLSGFVVTLMLFTGRGEGANELGLDDAETYVDKLIFLQFTQIFTLIVHVFCVVLSVAFLLAVASGIDAFSSRIIFSSSTAFMALSIVRTLLMPFQIFEVHLFELTVLKQMKREEFRKKSGFFDDEG